MLNIHPRAREALKLYVLGYSAKDAGYEMGISSRTIELYVHTAKTKCECGTKQDVRRFVEKRYGVKLIDLLWFMDEENNYDTF